MTAAQCGCSNCQVVQSEWSEYWH